jgi:trehalose-phosphatase
MPTPTTVLAELIAAPGRAAILCDIDGTLAPIVSDPEAAALPRAARELLRGLAGRYLLVACVSGRRAEAARRLVGLDQLTYVGNHGLELLRPGEREPRQHPALGEREAPARFVARLDHSALEAAAVRLEDKGPIQALHWRGAPDEELAERLIGELAKRAGAEGLVAHFGRKVLEIRPAAAVDKGVAARGLIAESGASSALFAGDDRTDLDAFAALRELEREGVIEHAVCVGVASPEGPIEIQEQADVVVDGTGGFLELLREL